MANRRPGNYRENRLAGGACLASGTVPKGGAGPCVSRLCQFSNAGAYFGIEADSGALPPQQAADLANTPLTILMENRFTDGLFIETMLDFFAPVKPNEQRSNAPDSIR
ncbi:MAG: hypothetical protein ACRESZ_08030 [Methylococcales bacterium]